MRCLYSERKLTSGSCLVGGGGEEMRNFGTRELALDSDSGHVTATFIVDKMSSAMPSCSVSVGIKRARLCERSDGGRSTHLLPFLFLRFSFERMKLSCSKSSPEKDVAP